VCVVSAQLWPWHQHPDPCCLLFHRHIILNGRELRLNPDGSLLPFRPKHWNMTKPLIMPPLSMVFWVIQEVHIPACEGQWVRMWQQTVLTYITTQMYTHTHTHTLPPTRTHTHYHPDVHVRTHTLPPTCTRTHTHYHPHVHTHAHITTHMYTHTHILPPTASANPHWIIQCHIHYTLYFMSSSIRRYSAVIWNVQAHQRTCPNSDIHFNIIVTSVSLSPPLSFYIEFPIKLYVLISCFSHTLLWPSCCHYLHFPTQTNEQYKL
jgi:hypothetical protein